MKGQNGIEKTEVLRHIILSLLALFLFADCMGQTSFQQLVPTDYFKERLNTFSKPDINAGIRNRYYKKDSGQTLTNTLSFKLNPFSCVFNQYSIEVGYQLGKEKYIGVEGGIIKANCWWNKGHKLYNGSDDRFPMGYYNGWLLSVHLRKMEINKQHWYTEVAPIFKR